NAPICDVTIRPVVDIMVIIANINQKIGFANICEGDTSVGGGDVVVAARRCWFHRIFHAVSGRRSAWATTRPAAAKIQPNRSSPTSYVDSRSTAETGNVVSSAPTPEPDA